MRKLCRSDWTGPLLARIFPKTQARLREAGPVVGLLTQAGPGLGLIKQLARVTAGLLVGKMEHKQPA